VAEAPEDTAAADEAVRVHEGAEAVAAVLTTRITPIQCAIQMQDPDTTHAAIDCLHRHLAEVLASGDTHLLTVLDKDEDGWNYATCVRELARVATAEPANITAITCLGLIAFSGNPSFYRQVKELNVIPLDYEVWSGWVLGIRIWMDFCLWNHKSFVGGHQLQFRLNCEKDLTPDLITPLAEDSSTYVGIKTKFLQLLDVYGVMANGTPSFAEKDTSVVLETMLEKASIMASFAKLKLGAIQECETEMQDRLSKQMAETSATANFSDAQSHLERNRSDLERAKNNLQAAMVEQSNAKRTLEAHEEAIDVKRNELATKQARLLALRAQ
jgi:hypothetical protein